MTEVKQSDKTTDRERFGGIKTSEPTPDDIIRKEADEAYRKTQPYTKLRG